MLSEQRHSGRINNRSHAFYTHTFTSIPRSLQLPVSHILHKVQKVARAAHARRSQYDISDTWPVIGQLLSNRKYMAAILVWVRCAPHGARCWCLRERGLFRHCFSSRLRRSTVLFKPAASPDVFVVLTFSVLFLLYFCLYPLLSRVIIILQQYCVGVFLSTFPQSG